MGGQDPAERPTECTRAHVFAGAVRKSACFSNSRLSDKRRQISHKNCVFLNFKKQGTSLVVKTASFQHRNVSLTPGWGMKILWAALAWGSRERLGRSACQGQGHRGRRLQEATVSPSETRLAKRRGGGEGTAASQAQTWSQRPCPESGPQAGEALWAEAGQGAPVKGREGLRAGPPVWRTPRTRSPPHCSSLTRRLHAAGATPCTTHAAPPPQRAPRTPASPSATETVKSHIQGLYFQLSYEVGETCPILR